MLFKFGKKPARHDPRLFQLSNYLNKATLPTPPAEFGHENLINSWGMLANDQYGCHDDQTEVLTDAGWQKWPEYDGKALLGTMNTATGMLEYQAPLAIKRAPYSGKMFYADHAAMDFALTPEHRMYHQQYHVPKPYTPNSAYWGQPQFKTIDSMSKRVRIPGCTNGFIGTGLVELEIGARKWSGDDFIALLSLIASDGWVGGSETTWRRISFCCFRDDRREMVAALAFRLGIKETVRRGVWEFTDPALADWLRANLFTSPTYRSAFKKVPDLVKVASQSQIHRFLDFYGDQHTIGDTRAYSSTSKQMIDDLQELLLKTGESGATRERPLRESHARKQDGTMVHSRSPEHTLYQRKREHLAICQTTRNPCIRDDYYNGDIFCATVPNSTLITRRNGYPLISGNCCVWAGAAHETMLWNAMARKTVMFTDAGVLSDYSAVTGFNPRNPASDQGTDMLEAASYRRKVGVLDGGGKRHKVAAYLGITPGDPVEHAVALYLFGAVGLGIEVPSSAITQFNVGKPWDVAKRSSILGGHYIPLVAKRNNMFSCVTWGRIQPMTMKFLQKYCDQSIVYVSEEMLTNGKSLEGFDKATLLADLNALPH